MKKNFFNWKLMALLALNAIGFQLIFDLLSWLRGDEEVFSFGRFFFKFLINYPNFILLCFFNFNIIKWLDNLFPWNNKRSIFSRVGLEIIAGLLAPTLLISAVNLLFYFFGSSEAIATNNLMFSILIGAILNCILLPTMELYFLFIRQYETALDNEWLKRENERFKYESLKAQLNPHFLFNSMNSLSALVSTDQAKAKKFIRKLSSVYRHVLEHQNKSLILMEEELHFLNDYTFLLQTRFDEGLTIHININEEHLHKKIVPMALQLLTENAVKHNQILIDSPLKISIYSEGNSVIVENNFQPKKSSNSSGVGLKNLKGRYLQLGGAIKIKTDEKIFRIIIPLFEK